MIAYITKQGSKICREGRRIIVKKDDEIFQNMYAWDISQVLIFGNITLTQPALSLFLYNKIDVSFYRLNGKYLGRFAHEEPKNVFMRKKQFLLTDNKEFCLKVSKAIIEGKLANQATILNRIKRARNYPPVGEIANSLRYYIHDAKNCQDIQSLRGIEGQAAKLYFSGLSKGFNDNFSFTKRLRNPPTDPINAVLSLVYTLLTNQVYNAIRQANLDPFPGVMHSLEYGRHSLALDLVEEFRPLVADTLTLALFNRKVLQIEDFMEEKEEEEDVENIAPTEKEEIEERINQAVADSFGAIEQIEEENYSLDRSNIAKSKRIILTEEAFKRVLLAFAKKLETRFMHPLEQREVSYTEAMVLQAKQYKAIVNGDKENYQTLQLR